MQHWFGTDGVLFYKIFIWDFYFFSVYGHNNGLNSTTLENVAMKLTAMGQFFLILIASCTHAIICSSNGNYTDRFSLLEFKNMISHDPQQALMSWNVSTHFCSWEGVRCSVKNPSRVSSLNLTNRGLLGQISPSLGTQVFCSKRFLQQRKWEERKTRLKIFTVEVVSLRLVSHSEKEVTMNAQARISGATSGGSISKVRNDWAGMEAKTSCFIINLN